MFIKKITKHSDSVFSLMVQVQSLASDAFSRILKPLCFQGNFSNKPTQSLGMF